MTEVNIDNLKKIYKLCYQRPTMRRVIHNDTGKVYSSKVLNDLTCGLLKGNKSGHYNFYVEKYYDKTHISCVILDYDGETAYQDIYNASILLANNKIMHFIVNSTNKGYHLYIILPKPVNFQLSSSKRVNNKIFVDFIINLVGDSPALDKANYGLFSNIRQLGSVHPKTGKVVRVEYAYAPFVDTNSLRIKTDYYNTHNDYFNRALLKSLLPLIYKDKINKIIKSRRKVTRYSNSAVDLRELFDGKSYDGGRTKWAKCRWHNDDKPSLHIYEKVAYCEVCGLIPFEDIKKEFNIEV